ncbi:MAG TPA: SDR family oxidoreductase, partial [Caldimonas sp.]|nr:SDR family oxidoreductase [Caldimonas sp.]
MGRKIRPLTLSGKTGIVSFLAITGKQPPCQEARTASDRVPESAATPPFRSFSMGFLAGKRLLVTGLLSNRSIAYGIARACHREGAELALSYQGERFLPRVTEFAAEFGSKLVFDCDVADDGQIERMFTGLGEAWPT